MEQSGNFSNPYRYAGYEYDGESELYYLKARYYDPAIARFMQEDSYMGDMADPLSLNLYAYCRNEPMMYYDPDGHTLISAIVAAVATVTGAVVKAAKDAIKKASANSSSQEKTSSGIDVLIINQSWGYKTEFINSIINYAGNTCKSSIDIIAGGYKYKIYEGLHYYIDDNGKPIYYNKDTNAVRDVAVKAGFRDEDIKFTKLKDDIWKSTIEIKGLFEGVDGMLKEGVHYYRDPTGKAYFYDAVRTLNEAQGNTVNYDNKTKTITIEDKNGRIEGALLKPGEDYYIGRDGKAYSTQGIPASFPTIVREAFQNYQRSAGAIYGDFDGVNGLQCVDITKWFIDTFTTLTWSRGHGKEQAANVAAANNLPSPTSSPTGISVFSVAGGTKAWGGSDTHNYGHTGILLYVDEDNKTATVIHTGSSREDKTPNSWLSTYSYPTSGVTFTNLGDYLK